MSLKGKILHTEDIKNYQTNFGEDIQFSIYGVFNTDSVEWKYYAISHVKNKITSDICNTNVINSNTIDVYNVKSGKYFQTKEEGIKYLKDFKIKWETGSNDTLTEIRDKKINDIIN
jgi:hypothetical protein